MNIIEELEEAIEDVPAGSFYEMEFHIEEVITNAERLIELKEVDDNLRYSISEDIKTLDDEINTIDIIIDEHQNFKYYLENIKDILETVKCRVGKNGSLDDEFEENRKHHDDLFEQGV